MSNAQSRVVLLVDISGSTRLYEELGNEQALARINACLRLLESAATELDGRVVKTMGDGLMCAFEEAHAALHAARTMQVRVAEQDALGGPALAVHVGCHYGPVLEDGGDLYGDCVNVAVRIADLAKPGQVITTQELVSLVDGELRERLRMLDVVSVKGKHEPLQIFELLWQDSEDLTTLSTRVEERLPRLRLVRGELEIWFNGIQPSVLRLGRDAACEVLVADRKASRLHARIEQRRDKFVLVDHSSNGTYVRIADEGELCVRHEELILREHGRIGLGHRTSDAEATIIDFYCSH